MRRKITVASPVFRTVLSAILKLITDCAFMLMLILFLLFILSYFNIYVKLFTLTLLVHCTVINFHWRSSCVSHWYCIIRTFII